MKEMLYELREHYELILLSAQTRKYVERVAKTVEKDEILFDHYITKEDLFLVQEI